MRQLLLRQSFCFSVRFTVISEALYYDMNFYLCQKKRAFFYFFSTLLTISALKMCLTQALAPLLQLICALSIALYYATQ